MTQRTATFLPTLVIAGLLAAGCATTHIESSWRKPGVTGASFQRIMVIAPSGEPGVRRSAEEALRRELPNAIPSHLALTDEQLGDREMIEKTVHANDADGVLVFNVVSVEQQEDWVPSTYGTSYIGYGAWPVYEPGYLYTTTVVRVDVNLYRASDGELVWASTSRKENPSSLDDLVHDTAEAVRKEMKNQGFIE